MELRNNVTATTSSFLTGGEMRKLIHQFDWAKTSIGDRITWSQTLQNLVNLMLVNRFPMLLWWGKDYIQIYNDPYIPVLGLKHPTLGLGQPASACWDEIWDVIGPLVDTPFNGGPATWMDDILLKVNRKNFNEETHFTIAYSPVPDPTAPNGIGGVLATVNEITQEIIGNRQMETLGKLGKAISTTLSVDEVYSQATSVMAENPFDIPFACIHQVNNTTGEATIAVTSGIDGTHPAIPKTIDLRHPGSTWPGFNRAVDEAIVVITQNNQTRDLPAGAWDTPPHQFAYLPIREGKRNFPVAVVTLALNPYRKFDDAYEHFAQLIADQISFGVTNAIAYEHERQRAEALTELDRAKTAFFSNVSHEFRTPLTLMLGPLDDLVAKSKLHNPVTTTRETIELIHRNALRLHKLVNTLLDFSRIEAGRMRASFRPTDIGRLTADLASNFRAAIEKAGLVFSVNCASIAAPVYVDHDLWEKIVLNLISNAFKFTFDGEIAVELHGADNHVNLIVRDTGTGIPTQELSRIFERFHRIPHARARTYEGSGIGLALVHELVKMHGGNITVTSEVGKGTVFSVFIPLGKEHLPKEQIHSEKNPAEASAINPAIFREEALRWLPDEGMQYMSIDEKAAGSGAHDRPRLILAEDNADMREYIKSVLNEFADVYPASNGAVALELIGQVNPDLVISDIMMPEVDGFRLLESIRNDAFLRSTPVIFLSARAGEEAKVEGLRSGADDYLIKPFSRNELVARVTSNLQLSRVRKEVEQVVRYSEAQLRALVTATSDVIYRMSADWKIMRQLDGRNFLQDTGEPMANWEEKYIHPKDRARVWQVINESIRTKNIFQLEHQVIRADGTLGWTFSRAVPILDRNGDIIEWFGTASDISTRKFYEAELELRVEDRTKELNEANAALKTSNEDLQQFAHVASHDLKEPVRKIKTFTYRLRDDKNNFLTEESQLYLNKVLASAERMSAMIDGVLTYSSINGAHFEVSDVNLNEIIEDIKGDLELLTQQKGGTIQSTQLPVIRGGRVLLYQLFYNLLSNALKFSHPKRLPKITVSAKEIIRRDRKWHAITVSDNGIGFDTAYREKIFDTFTRLNPKDKYDGTGLGLSLCRKIVERHHGIIYADGAMDQGATFTIELPQIKDESK